MDHNTLEARLKANRSHDRQLRQSIIAAAASGDRTRFSAGLTTMPLNDEQWHFIGQTFVAMARMPFIHDSIRQFLIYFWVRYGDELRGEFSRAEAIRFCRAIFPPYMGPGVELYRGENGTWAKRIPSLSWTRNLEVARAFARQCAQFHRSGGVVLHAYVPTSYVIADLTAYGHDGEDEFIVDARGLKFEIVERLVPQLAI